jgi:protein-tyrosine phosphatase
MSDNARILPLDGASNFRDLGGFPTTDGGFTRWGTLFRSDALHELTDDDMAVVRGIGLRTVIDLRTAVEVERTGRGPLGGEDAQYVHLSVIDADGGESRGIPAPVDEDLANRYLWYLEIGREALVGALEVLGSSSNYPLVFHCAAGKDRTGVLAALVLEIIGVERAVIVDDYALTASRMELILERLLRNTPEGKSLYDLPATAFAVEATTMQRFLEALDDRHGGARRWALAAGVSGEQLDAMAGAVVAREGPPSLP